MEILNKFNVNEKVWFHEPNTYPIFKEGIIRNIVYWNRTTGIGYEIITLDENNNELLNTIDEINIFSTKEECLATITFIEYPTNTQLSEDN
ncbi:MAG: hypothetical protein IJH39_05610 [Clostridia bacterium]|nr:hypothetical protein [Clostridia bacterium]